MSKLDEAMRLCTEIGLQTYCRKPHEMHESTDWQKLQMAEGLVRNIRSLICEHQKNAANLLVDSSST